MLYLFVIFINCSCKKMIVMTKLILEIKNDRDADLIRALLRDFEIEIIEEEIQKEQVESSVDEFYGKFSFDLSSFKFDREEANAR